MSDDRLRHGASAYPVFVEEGWIVYEPDSADDGSCLGWVRTTFDGDRQSLMLSIDGDSVVLSHDGVEVHRWSP